MPDLPNTMSWSGWFAPVMTTARVPTSSIAKSLSFAYRIRTGRHERLDFGRRSSTCALGAGPVQVTTVTFPSPAELHMIVTCGGRQRPSCGIGSACWGFSTFWQPSTRYKVRTLLAWDLRRSSRELARDTGVLP